MKKTRISSVAAIVIGALVTMPLLIFGFMNIQSALTRASNMVPENVQVAQVADTSVVVVWTTGIETQGIIEYGTEPDALIKFAPEAVVTTDHQVKISLLEPATTYYYRIRIGTDTYDNDGVPFSFTTAGGDTGEETGTEELPGAGESSDEPIPGTDVLPGELNGDPGAGGSAPGPGGAGENNGGQPPADQPGNGQNLPQERATPPIETGTCPETDNCADIQENLGRGCSSADYLRCIRQQEQ